MPPNNETTKTVVPPQLLDPIPILLVEVWHLLPVNDPMQSQPLVVHLPVLHRCQQSETRHAIEQVALAPLVIGRKRSELAFLPFSPQ